MNHKIKIELDKGVIRVSYWEKSFWIFGTWVPYYNKSYGSAFDAYVDYETQCRKINPFFKP